MGQTSTMATTYVHGYTERESRRLQDQASTLVELLHSDTRFPSGTSVLEAGCGVGAQTVTLIANSPGVKITALDISPTSLATARDHLDHLGHSDLDYVRGDVFNPPFAANSFDHVFACFVLEHLADPVAALASLKAVVKPAGTITVIEGDHGSTYFHPDSRWAQRAIQCQVELQSRSGGNANIGRSLYPLLDAAGWEDIAVSPRMVYVDGSRPHLIEGFTRNTFTAMIEGIRQPAIEAELIDATEFDRGVADLYRTASLDGTFCYTFFKAVARA